MSVRVDLEALPALVMVRVAGEAVTALNGPGAARLAREGALREATRLATELRRPVEVRVDGREGGVRLLLCAPVTDGVQVMALDLSWVIDAARLSALAPGLTPREREVVALLLLGLGPGHVAERLGITWHTARSHIRNAYRALDITERAELAVIGRALLTPHVDGWTPVAPAAQGGDS